MSRSWQCLILLVAVAVLIAGCGDKDAPAPSGNADQAPQASAAKGSPQGDLAHADSFNRAQAAYDIKVTEYVLQVVPLLNDADAGVRVAAINALGMNEAREHAPAVAQHLKNSETAWAAATALAQMQAKEYIGEIAGLLTHKDVSLRAYAALALGWMDAREHAKEVAALLKESESQTRGAAVFALGKFDAKEYARDMVALLKDYEQPLIGETPYAETKAFIIGLNVGRILTRWGLDPEKMFEESRK